MCKNNISTLSTIKRKTLQKELDPNEGKHGAYQDHFMKLTIFPKSATFLWRQIVSA